MDSSSNNDVIPSLGEEEEGNDTMEPVEANSRSNTPTGSGQDRKRKRTSAVWSSFVIVGKNAQRKEHCKCKYCGKQYICEGTHGTGNMKRHIEFQCPKIMMHDPRQMLLKNNKSANMTVSNPKSQNEFRTIVAETIVLHDLPFSFVEWSGVRKMIGYCTDEFHMVSRNTAKANCYYYRLAWTALELADSNYKHCPSESEWENVEKLCKFLRHFYDTTNLFSGTKYPTSNLYMPKVFITYLTLMQNLASDDPFFKAMSNQMYTKFNKYWFDFSTILAIAIILDPRYKMEFVMFVYERLYGAESKQLEEVKGKLFALFNEYVTSSTGRSTIRPSPPSYPSTSSGRQRVDDLDLVLLDFDNNINGDIVDIQRTQLDLYLEERRLERSIDLNILDFWKGNEPRYPELAAMARDVLSVPISTVASESAFSMGGRVLDQFRSSLLPNVAEALVCSRDWILGNGGNDFTVTLIT
ncbi:hypothetical protein Ddye_020235, partial [Dipteronia dyeriana]